MIPSISLPPVTTCVKNVACVKDCYANRIVRRWEHVRKQWLHNLWEYNDDAGIYFNTLHRFLDISRPAYFRFHIGGDCPDEYYAKQLIQLCGYFPKTRFLIFTKRYTWFGIVPPNLSVIFSMWPYIKEPESKFRKSWVRGDLRANSRELYKCKGKCTDCLYCYHADNELGILLKPH